MPKGTQPDPHWTIHAGNMIFGDSPTMRNDRYMPSIHSIMQAGNLYMYAIHNPVMWVDPSGKFIIKSILAIAAGVTAIYKKVTSSNNQNQQSNAPPQAPPPATAPGSSAAAPRTGVLTGNPNSLTGAERRMVNDLLTQGNNIQLVPRAATGRSFDFLVNGVSTELKTLMNPNVNTGITRIQQGFAQNNPSVVIIDARGTGLTISQANEMVMRAAGTFPNRTLPGQVQVWTDSGIFTGGRR